MTDGGSWMELRLGVRLCGTGSLKAWPCSKMLPVSCRLLRQRQKHLHVVSHQQRSRSWFNRAGMRCRGSLGKQLAALCQNTPWQGGEDGEWLCKVNIRLQLGQAGIANTLKKLGLNFNSEE